MELSSDPRQARSNIALRPALSRLNLNYLMPPIPRREGMFTATATDPNAFRSGRAFAAWDRLFAAQDAAN